MFNSAKYHRQGRQRPSKGFSGRWVPLAALLAVAVMLVATSVSAAAQNDATCSNVGDLGASHLHVSQQAGRALVEIDRLDGSGQRVEVDYGDEAFISKIDADGKAQIGFVLLASKADFEIRLTETPTIRCKIDVPDFKKIHRVVLLWRDPVQLNLHIIEPEGRLGGVGDIGPDRPNLDMSRGMGQMDLIASAPQAGATAETSYFLPGGAAQASGRLFDYRVEYATRGMKPALPYCDDGQLASVPMDLIIIDHGVVTTTNVGTNRLHCGVAVPENRRFMVLMQ